MGLSSHITRLAQTVGLDIKGILARLAAVEGGTVLVVGKPATSAVYEAMVSSLPAPKVFHINQLVAAMDGEIMLTSKGYPFEMTRVDAAPAAIFMLTESGDFLTGTL